MTRTKLLVGTQNQAKLARYQTILAEIPELDIVSPADTGLHLTIPEDGATAQDNARIKARAYLQATGLPTLSADDALYIDALSIEEQPGVDIRRYLGGDPSDDEILRAFMQIVEQLPPRERGVIWTYAFCLALPDGRELCDQVEVPAVFIDCPVLPMLPGYPLSSILFNTEIGKVHREMSPQEERWRLKDLYTKVQTCIRSAITPRGHPAPTK